MGIFTAWRTKLGPKPWSSIKNSIQNLYHPLKKMVSTVRSGRDYVDNLLNKAIDIGVPSSLIDLVRDNPLYQTVSGTIDIASDLVEKDLPRYGNLANRFVENHLQHSVTEPHIRKKREMPDEMQGSGMPSGIVSTGFTPNYSPVAGQAVTNQAVA